MASMASVAAVALLQAVALPAAVALLVAAALLAALLAAVALLAVGLNALAEPGLPGLANWALPTHKLLPASLAEGRGEEGSGQGGRKLTGSWPCRRSFLAARTRPR